MKINNLIKFGLTTALVAHVAYATTTITLKNNTNSDIHFAVKQGSSKVTVTPAIDIIESQGTVTVSFDEQQLTNENIYLAYHSVASESAWPTDITENSSVRVSPDSSSLSYSFDNARLIPRGDHIQWSIDGRWV